MAIPRFWVLTKENLKFEINLFWIAMVLATASGPHYGKYRELPLEIHNTTYFFMRDVPIY